jgi:hypothetical protein
LETLIHVQFVCCHINDAHARFLSL